MRFLADAGVSPKTVEFAQQLGHEAVHVRTLGLQRATDSQIVQRARADSSVIITNRVCKPRSLALFRDRPTVNDRAATTGHATAWSA